MSCFSVCDRRYNYSKEDEEMFKEFYDIANVFIPNILKQSSSPAKDGKETYRPAEDPQFFAYLLQFHDGIWSLGGGKPHTSPASRLGKEACAVHFENLTSLSGISGFDTKTRTQSPSATSPAKPAREETRHQ